MRLPNFTAEHSLYKSINNYRLISIYANVTNFSVYPSQDDDGFPGPVPVQRCTSDEDCLLSGFGGQCIDGMCKCLPPRKICNSVCVDVSNNPVHCGNCNTPPEGCKFPRQCTNGMCICPPPANWCPPDGCVFPNDKRHCGMCNNHCDDFRADCENGRCVCSAAFRPCGTNDCCDQNEDCMDGRCVRRPPPKPPTTPTGNGDRYPPHPKPPSHQQQ
jgi:hypothetical protein